MPEYVVGVMKVNAPNRNNTIISEQVARKALQDYMDYLVQQEMVKTYKIFVDEETAQRLQMRIETEK